VALAEQYRCGHCRDLLARCFSCEERYGRATTRLPVEPRALLYDIVDHMTEHELRRIASAWASPGGDTQKLRLAIRDALRVAGERYLDLL
jgi:hypothetical protein